MPGTGVPGGSARPASGVGCVVLLAVVDCARGRENHFAYSGFAIMNDDQPMNFLTVRLSGGAGFPLPSLNADEAAAGLTTKSTWLEPKPENPWAITLYVPA